MPNEQPKEHQSNREAWNEAAAYYQKGLSEAVELLKKGGHTFIAPELRVLEKLKAQLGHCIHLQCAGGTDSLSLLNYGAKSLLGIDISDEMIRVAEEKTRMLGWKNAQWLRSDVLEIPAHLNATADLLYTGKGALNWMMDINAWGLTVARLLKPGGAAYIFEGHPFTYCFDMKAATLAFDPAWKGYFYDSTYASADWPDTYVGKVKEQQATKYEKAWPVSQVITALLQAGLTLERFEEHPDKFWDEFEHLPDELRTRFPNTYSVVARKPALR